MVGNDLLSWWILRFYSLLKSWEEIHSNGKCTGLVIIIYHHHPRHLHFHNFQLQWLRPHHLSLRLLVVRQNHIIDTSFNTKGLSSLLSRCNFPGSRAFGAISTYNMHRLAKLSSAFPSIALLGLVAKPQFSFCQGRGGPALPQVKFHWSIYLNWSSIMQKWTNSMVQCLHLFNQGCLLPGWRRRVAGWLTGT